MPRGAAVLSGSPRLAAGRRDSTVTIQQARPVTATTGVEIENWVDLHPTERMSRLDVRADERDAANQTSAFVETVWQMPYRCDMDPDLVDVPAKRRLVFSGRAYDIRSAVRIGRHGIELLTVAGSRLPAVVS